MNAQLAPPVSSKTFWRFAHAKGFARGHALQAVEVAKNTYGADHALDVVVRAAVVAESTADFPALRSASREAIAAIRPLTVLGRLRNTRPVGMDVHFASVDTSQSAGWVNEGEPAPLVAMNLGAHLLKAAKVGGIAVVSAELMRLTNAAAILEAEGTRLLVQAGDRMLTDPSIAAGSATPASLTNGAVEIISSGPDPASILADVRNLLAALRAAGSDLQSVDLICSSACALYLSTLTNSDGSPAFEGITAAGGVLGGLPLLAGGAVYDNVLIAADGSEILLGDPGIGGVDVATEATLQMRDDPQSGPTVQVSLLQTDAIAFRFTRWLNWAMRRPAMSAYVSGFPSIEATT